LEWSELNLDSNRFNNKVGAHSKKMQDLIGAVLLLLLLLTLSNSVLAENVSVSWTLPTQREDGSELKETSIKHFDVYYSATGKNGEFKHLEKLVGINKMFSRELAPGDHCLYVTVTDATNLTSANSNMHCVGSRPKAPILISITITIEGVQ